MSPATARSTTWVRASSGDAAGTWRSMRPAATSPRSSPVRRMAPTCSSSARSSGCWWPGRERRLELRERRAQSLDLPPERGQIAGAQRSLRGSVLRVGPRDERGGGGAGRPRGPGRARLRAGRRCAAEDRRERLAQRRRNHHVLLLPRRQIGRGRRGAVEDDHSLDLRQRGGGGLQVQRLDVQERVLDRHREQVAEDDVRALLAPQCALGRDHRILVDGRLHLGRAVSFEFPSSLNVYGPAQVEAAINQDPVISAQRTLWGQQGSHVIFGNLLTVPIQDSLLYVQPLYLQSSTTALPQIQRVIVFYRSPSATPNLPTGQQQNVVMAPTLGEALATIFGGAPPPGCVPGSPGAKPSPRTTGAAAALIARANAQYAAAQAALRAGDLATFGRQIQALGKTLAQLKAAH